jgi:hypothetical protein
MSAINEEFLDYIQKLAGADGVMPFSQVELQFARAIWFCASAAMLANLSTAYVDGQFHNAVALANAECLTYMNENKGKPR